jgi:hypothetical protein
MNEFLTEADPRKSTDSESLSEGISLTASCAETTFPRVYVSALTHEHMFPALS